jgi:hypothetical protein
VLARDVLKQVFNVLGVPEGDQPTLVAYDAEERLVKRIDLTDEDVTIGRTTDNRLVLYHASVSKNHAKVVRDGITAGPSEARATQSTSNPAAAVLYLFIIILPFFAFSILFYAKMGKMSQ